MGAKMKITVHYEDNRTQEYRSENPKVHYWAMGYRFDYCTGVFCSSRMGKTHGYFEIVEKSEDGSEVWVEYYE